MRKKLSWQGFGPLDWRCQSTPPIQSSQLQMQKPRACSEPRFLEGLGVFFCFVFFFLSLSLSHNLPGFPGARGAVGLSCVEYAVYLV